MLKPIHELWKQFTQPSMKIMAYIHTLVTSRIIAITDWSIKVFIDSNCRKEAGEILIMSLWSIILNLGLLVYKIKIMAAMKAYWKVLGQTKMCFVFFSDFGKWVWWFFSTTSIWKLIAQKKLLPHPLDKRKKYCCTGILREHILKML